MVGVKGGQPIIQTRFQLEHEQMTNLRNIFHLLDKDMDGFLQEDQLLTALSTVGINPTRRIRHELQKRLPRRKNSKGLNEGINFETFARIIRSTLIAQPTAVTEIDAITMLYESPDKPGIIKGHELRHLLTGVETSSHTQLSMEETNSIFETLGLTEEGDVNIHHYVDIVADGFIKIVNHRKISDNGYRNKMKIKNKVRKSVQSG